MRGRMPVGKGTHSDVSTLGNNDGVAVANRRPKHKHTPHSHITAVSWNLYTAGNYTTNGLVTETFQDFIQSNSANYTSTSVDGGSGNTSDPLDAPAYLIINYIIKT
jgi:hypothetical protein